MRGSLAEAERDAHDACEELLAWAPRYAGWAYHELGEVRRRRGDLQGARTAFGRALDVGFDPQPGLALLRLDESDPGGALAAINRRMADRDAFTAEARALLLPAQITIALAGGDLDLARAALAELEEAAAECDTTSVLASARAARGALALAGERHGEAIVALREAWRLWCDLGARFDAAQARTLLGRAVRPAATGLPRGSSWRAHGLRLPSWAHRSKSNASSGCWPIWRPVCARPRHSCSPTSWTRRGWWSCSGMMAGTAC